MNIVLHCRFDYIKLLISCQATASPFSRFISCSFYEKPHISPPSFRHTEQKNSPIPRPRFRRRSLGVGFYNFFVNNLFNFSPASFSFPLFYRYLRWKSGLFLQPVCHFHQRHFPNFFLLFLGNVLEFPLEGTDRKKFSARPSISAKKVGKVPFPSANLQYFQIIPGKPRIFLLLEHPIFSITALT